MDGNFSRQWTDFADTLSRIVSTNNLSPEEQRTAVRAIASENNMTVAELLGNVAAALHTIGIAL